MFESNNAIGDEIRYVFDRKNHKSQMGNTLDRPTLLMKRNFLKFTNTDKESLNDGTSYKKHDLGAREKAGGAHYGGARSKTTTASDRVENKIKDFQNFLASAPHQLFNLKPDANGLVAFKLGESTNYT